MLLWLGQHPFFTPAAKGWRWSLVQGGSSLQWLLLIEGSFCAAAQGCQLHTCDLAQDNEASFCQPFPARVRGHTSHRQLRQRARGIDAKQMLAEPVSYIACELGCASS